MRVVLFGWPGMLGTAICRALTEAGVDVHTVPHQTGSIDSLSFVSELLAAVQPDVVVNAAGVIPLAGRSAVDMINANATGPNILAAACRAHGARLLHVSTDCVFSGGILFPTRYRDRDAVSANDIYGLSKALGEVRAPHVTVVRTSFVGPQHGLWAWLRRTPPGATVEGWEQSYWSGSTVDAVADRLARMVSAPIMRMPPGVFHLATAEPTTKAAVLRALDDQLAFGVNIESRRIPYYNRALHQSPELGPPLMPFEEALREHVARALAHA